MTSRAEIEALSRGFRARYLPYEELTAQVRAWASAFPSFVRLTSLTQTPEGRELWLLTIGHDPDRARPALWVDGNMHASEVTGSSVALAFAEDVIAALATGEPPRDLPAHVWAWMQSDGLFYVLPRMCPDGAERVLTTGAWVRSNPRDGRLGRSFPYWKAHDVDGDGAARLLRRLDPAGEFVASSEIPNLLLPRRIEDEGPFYAVYSEGTIEGWDGFTIPPHHFLSDNETDMNRNFPYGWAPEPAQVGAGPFPASEPESRAVVEFASRTPTLFAWLNLHTYGGCYIRPPGDHVDKKMHPDELALYRQIGEWTEAITGYPTVSGFEEFTYEPDKPLHGDLVAFAHEQRGTVAMVCELWDFFAQVGLTVKRPFVDNYSRRSREDILAMARWDRDENQGRVVGAWRPFDHPQIGPVEVGGYDPRFGIWNPPPERLHALCEAQSKLLLRLAALAPRPEVKAAVKPLGEGLFEVSAVVQNIGYLPTYVLSSAKAAPWNDPIHAEIALGEGQSLVSGVPKQRIGHLEGWGAFEGWHTPSFARSERGVTRGRASWVVKSAAKGKGRVTVTASAARVGAVRDDVEIG